MRPKYKVDLPHLRDTATLDSMVEWLTSNVGKPSSWDTEASYQKLDWNSDGDWCCVAGANKYNRQPGDTLVDTWWFANEKDAVFFSLRYS